MKLSDKEKYALPYHWPLKPTSAFEVHYKTYSEQVVSLLPPPPLKVLDAGCGDGRVADMLLRRGYCGTGVDFSERAIAFARIFVPDATFYVCELRSLEEHSPGGSFDAGALNGVLEHIHPIERGAVLKAIYYVLKNKGILVLSVPTPRLPQSPYHYDHFNLDGGYCKITYRRRTLSRLCAVQP